MDLNFFKQTRVLDGGMGQELLARGMKPNGTLWSANAILDENYHQLLEDTHRDFVKAGAEVIVTTTFTTRRKRLRENNIEDKFEYLNIKAGEIASNVKKEFPNILIAGGLPPQELTYQADERSEDEITKTFNEQAKLLNDYVDFFYLDVISSGREIDIASNVAAKLNKPVLLGIHVKKNNLLPSNESITEVLQKYRNGNWIGLITACVSPKIAEECTSEIKKLNIPFGFKANLWKVEEPTPVQTFNTAKPDEIGTNPNVTLGKRDNNSAKMFYDFSKRLVEQGATILGGCCETTPEDIEEIAKLR